MKVTYQRELGVIPLLPFEAVLDDVGAIAGRFGPRDLRHARRPVADDGRLRWWIRNVGAAHCLETLRPRSALAIKQFKEHTFKIIVNYHH